MNRKSVKENTRCFKSAVDLQLGTQIIKSPTHSSRSILYMPHETSSGEQLCNKTNMYGCTVWKRLGRCSLPTVPECWGEKELGTRESWFLVPCKYRLGS